MRIVRRPLHTLLVPAVLVALWWVPSAVSSSPFFRPLEDILQAFRANWLLDRVGSDVALSLRRMLEGYALAW